MDDVPRSVTSGSTQFHAEDHSLRAAILSKLHYSLGKHADNASDLDWYQATALAVRDRVMDIWTDSSRRAEREQKKHVYYLSIEFLIGRLLFDTLTNLGLLQTARQALASLGINLDKLRECEPDAALGNGGLGRLAACYMDSMSALSIPAYGYGIRYENGLFEQRIHDGWQQEFPEDWLARGNPWEFPRSDTRYRIGFGGYVEYLGGDPQTARAIWHPNETVMAVAYDTPITGWRGRHVNALRLWSARATSPIHLTAFNEGDYTGAMAARTRADAITRVLYPNDSTLQGQELRLRQEYFFTSASLQDLVQRHLQQHESLRSLPDKAAVQLNDTHPAIAVAELMRILVDEQEFSWTLAWDITRKTLSYTNHTLLPEALESWAVGLFGRLLPRHLQIIYLINWLHLNEAKEKGTTSESELAAVSLIHEAGGQRVRMAHLAFLGSHHVNGVSALHTDLLKKTVFHDLAKTTPTVIVNKTNGISFRRWLFEANEPLTTLLQAQLGERVLDDPESLLDIEPLAKEPNFVERYKAARLVNKERLVKVLRAATGIKINANALFDIHIKRIHEYKRQLLNLLEAIALYREIKARPDGPWVPRVKIFAGKAAASYDRAKLIIKLAHDVARVIDSDPAVGDKLKVIFAPNYSVSLAEQIIPAADLSEQISTAGMEASGTGNMKLALNGAITIGTLDGANVEMCERAGAENMVIFGLTTPEVAERHASQYKGAEAAARSPRLAAVLDSLTAGDFCLSDSDRYVPLVQSLLDHDRFMVAADFDAYWDAQRKVDDMWRKPEEWWSISIMNTARMGWFSSDRAVREYADEIWQTPVEAA